MYPFYLLLPKYHEEYGTLYIINIRNIHLVCILSLQSTYPTKHVHKITYLGPIGIPFFGCFFNAIKFIPFSMYLGQNYSPIAMYPLGPHRYQIIISDLDLMFKLSRNPSFTDRPRDMYCHLQKIPRQFAAINGEEWKKRRNLFYNSMLKITDSKYIQLMFKIT